MWAVRCEQGGVERGGGGSCGWGGVSGDVQAGGVGRGQEL